MADYFKYIEQLSGRLESAKNIVIICHVNPDGDAVGSQLALYHFLLSKGKKASMISPNNLQDFLTWMDGVEEICIYTRNRKDCNEMIASADLVIMVDFNQSNRLGEAENAVLKSKAYKVIIDHHLDPGSFTDLMISDTSRCSTSELIHILVTGINKGHFVNRSYAEVIYVGIITDTGNFEHGSFTGETFRIIADLLDAGIDRERIYNLVFNNFSADRMKLKGLSLNERMVVLPELHTAYIVLSKSDLENYNYRKGDTEGFVNMPLSISGIRFSALLMEKKDHIKLSFRSKGTFPVNEFAQKYFSGGGHRNASGGEYRDTLDNTVSFFLAALDKESGSLRASEQK
ncbi:MAG: bifunctional oligoribonuclease/PAP phosphatase NrnA [Bacteroidales bacterium]